jgi:hypothetical protein
MLKEAHSAAPASCPAKAGKTTRRSHWQLGNLAYVERPMTLRRTFARPGESTPSPRVDFRENEAGKLLKIKETASKKGPKRS